MEEQEHHTIALIIGIRVIIIEIEVTHHHFPLHISRPFLVTLLIHRMQKRRERTSQVIPCHATEKRRESASCLFPFNLPTNIKKGKEESRVSVLITFMRHTIIIQL